MYHRQNLEFHLRLPTPKRRDTDRDRLSFNQDNDRTYGVGKASEVSSCRGLTSCPVVGMRLWLEFIPDLRCLRAELAGNLSCDVPAKSNAGTLFLRFIDSHLHQSAVTLSRPVGRHSFATSRADGSTMRMVPYSSAHFGQSCRGLSGLPKRSLISMSNCG
jgi:hypothetical protein